MPSFRTDPSSSVAIYSRGTIFARLFKNIFVQFPFIYRAVQETLLYPTADFTKTVPSVNTLYP